MEQSSELKYLGGTAAEQKAENYRTQSAQDKQRNSHWTKLLVFAGYASTLGSAVPGGYCIGVVNSPAAHMRSWCKEVLQERYNLQLSDGAIDILWSAIVSIFLVGGAVGSFSGAWAANKFGRKGSFSICGILFCAGAILFYCCRLAHSVEMLLLGRFIVGIAAGLTTATLPMYLTEIAPLALRGTLGVFCAVGFTAGVVVGQVCSLQIIFGSAERWHIALSFYVVLVLLCYAPITYYPESPKWLYVIVSNKEGALAQLNHLRGVEHIDDNLKEMDDMEADAGQQKQAVSFMAVLKDSSLRLPLIIVCAYQGGQQLSGINAIFFYSVSIFRRVGLSTEAAEMANLGAGCLNLATSLLGPTLMTRLNRRFLMLFSSFHCALFLLLFAIMLYLIDSIHWFGIGCIICIFLYIFFYQFGVGPIPFFIGSELFEVAPRPVAMAMGSVASWSCNFIVGMSFPSLQSAWGPFVFIPCSITCALLFVLTKLYLPETRGRDASEVAPLMSRGFKSTVR